MNYRYQKKPIEVQAFQMTPERFNDNSDWPEWLNYAWQKENDEPGALFNHLNSKTGEGGLAINTLEGRFYIYQHDWIIRGIQGELYPCKPDIFEATYQELPPGPPSPPIGNAMNEIA